MLLTLFDSNGNAKLSFSPADSSAQVKEIQADNVLSLSFTTYEYAVFGVNDYVDFLGERYWVMQEYAPNQLADRKWKYDVRMYGAESLIKRYLVLDSTGDGDSPEFTLTAPASVHLALIVRSINGGMGTDVWTVGDCVQTDNLTIEYNGKYCDEALKDLADKAGTEYWFDGTAVCICRCEWGDEVILGYGSGIVSITPDTARNTKFYTRLFPLGSTRNIDPSRYGHQRLQLPGGAKYVDADAGNISKYGIIHHYEEAAFSGIYPRRIGTVSSVRSEAVTDESGNPFTIYHFKDSGLNFNPNDYQLAGEVIRVSFQDGELAGLGTSDDHYFEVNYNPATAEFEIITIWPDGVAQLPGGLLAPHTGDRYILWNMRMPDEYYTLAEHEFKDAVDAYNAEHSIDITVFKCPTDFEWVERNDILLEPGRRVRLESSRYFPGTGYRSSRITKITRKVNKPSQMDLEIGDALGRTSTNKILDSIKDAVSGLRTYMVHAFRTGIISQTQSQAIQNYINIINTTLRQAAQDYQAVRNNRILANTADDGLLAARRRLVEAYQGYTDAAAALLEVIQRVIADNEITQAEVDNINNLYNGYNNAYSLFCTELAGLQNMLISSNADSITALDNRFLRKANTKENDPEGDVESLPITFEPKQIFLAGFKSIDSFVSGITGKGTDLTIVNTLENGAVTATDDVFTTDFVVARKRAQATVGWMEEAEFGTFINGGSGFVSSFVSNDGLNAVGRGAKIYASGAIESGTVDSRGNLVARGVSYADGGNTVYLANTGEVIGYNALQAGRIYTPGAAGSGIRFNSSGYGELSQLALRQHLVNSGVFADGFFGEGFKLWNDDGTWKMTIDQLTVRQIMNVYELLVNRIRAVGGTLVVSPASGKIKSIASEGDYYKIRFESGNDSFAANDLVRMQRFTGEDYKHDGVGQVVTGYWVEVVDTRWERVTSHNAAGILEQTEQVIWIRKDDIGLWDMPAVGDEVVQLGNTVNPARQSLIALTANESTVSDGSGGQVGTPTIDILTGVNRRNFSGTNRTRLGYLGDIVDSAFYNITTGVVESPQGYGLYSDNAYLKGRFVLADGSDVYTMFTVQSGRFESAIGNISSTVMTDRENYLSDVSFANRLANWVTNKESVYFQQPLQTWILANGGVLSFNPHKVSVQSHGGISTVDLGNGSLTQRNAVMSRTPYVMEVNRTTQQLLTVERARVVTDLVTGQENYQTDSGGNLIYDTYVVMQDGSEILQSTYAASPGSYSPCFTTEYVYDQSGHILKDKSATPVWLTFMIAVETAGTLTIGFDNEVTDGFSSFAPFSVSEQLSPTGDDGNGGLRYVEKSFTGYWSGSGDFTIAYTGKCSIYGLRLWSDMELQYATKIRQTNEYIRLEAEARNAMGDAYKSMLEVTARQIQSIVSTSDGRISTVKQTADGVSAEVADARGNNASLKLRIDGISSDVSTISGQVSSLQQTASSLSGYVGSFAPGSTLADALAATQRAAEAVAATDATSKMNSAVSSAASDATTKMNTAISTAALDALSKANAAEGNAKSYADGLDTAVRLFVTSGFVAQSDFATMYASAVSTDNTIVKTANMGVYVTWDATTHQLASGAVINADQINFVGRSVAVSNGSVNTFVIDSSGNVAIRGDIYANGGTIGGIGIHNGSLGTKTYNSTNATSRMYIDASEMQVTGIGGSVRLYAEVNDKITVSNLTAGASAIDATSVTSGRAITARGRVYIDGDLEVTGNINFQVPTSGSGSGNVVTNYSFNSDHFSVSGGTVSLKNPISGTVTAGDFSLSDERMKNIVGDIRLSVEDIALAPSKLFTLKHDRKKVLQGGTTAQYWENIAPWGVRVNAADIKEVSYSTLAFAAAVQDAREIVRLKKRVHDLEMQLSA